VPNSRLIDCKTAIRDKRLLRFWYAVINNYNHPDIKLFKPDFVTFLKLCLTGPQPSGGFAQARSREQPFSDSELGDLFLLFCKRLEGPPPAEPSLNLANSKKSAPTSSKKEKEQAAQLLTRAELELRDLKLDLAQVDVLFDKWFREEENLSGALNMKLIKQRNAELRQKLEAWRRRADERKRVYKRAFEHGKRLRGAFEKTQDDFNIEKEKVIACVIDYNQFEEAKDRTEKEEKIVNDFLCQLPDGVGHQILEIKDLERLLENETRNFKQESNLLREFAMTVRSECVMNQHFFSFFDVPDLILKKKYPKKDYETIIKLLNKVKKAYLVHKATILPDKPLTALAVTDEDLVPLELFDQVL
jgi:hypothetical protein